MSQQPAEAESNRTQTVFPMLAYANGPAAMDLLVRVFGFRERTRLLDDAGRLAHGELSIGDGLVMLATPSPDYEGPKQHREHCERAARWSEVPWIVDGVLVLVDDVAAHFARARREGARILSPLEPGPPAVRYRAEDVEGHRWMFMERSQQRALRSE
jgi:uncharacterized glyoxalase superfamily protein PhnB